MRFNRAMKTVALTLAAATAAVLAGPSAAQAVIASVPDQAPEGTPLCPTNCLALTKTIGYQAKIGTNRGLMTVKKDGTLVSWSVQLGAPNEADAKSFTTTYGESQASIAVLRPGRKLRARVVAVSTPVKMAPYFGKAPEFALDKTIPVKKGWIIALSVPTWIPAYTSGLTTDTSWRASRKKGACTKWADQTAYAQDSIPQFWCLYRGERIFYSARVVSTT